MKSSKSFLPNTSVCCQNDFYSLRTFLTHLGETPREEWKSAAADYASRASQVGHDLLGAALGNTQTSKLLPQTAKEQKAFTEYQSLKQMQLALKALKREFEYTDKVFAKANDSIGIWAIRNIPEKPSGGNEAEPSSVANITKKLRER